MSVRSTVAVLAGLYSVPAAFAGIISFSFSPPTSGGILTNIANGAGVDTGLMAFDQNAPLNFTVNGTNEGFGIVNFPNARMALSMTLAPAADLGGGLFSALVQGNFAIYDYTGNVRSDIITGTVSGGTFLSLGTSNFIVLNTNTGLNYSAGPELTSLLAPGRVLAASQDGNFVLNDARTPSGSTAIIGAGGAFQTFFANTGFTGTSNVVPTPGALLLAAAGGLMVTRRRR